MRYRIAPQSKEALALLNQPESDGSGVGINFADLYIKGLNHATPEGVRVACKRHGLRIELCINEDKGHAFLRRRPGASWLEITTAALEEASTQLGWRLEVEDEIIYLTPR